MKDHVSVANLKDVYLEDSYVLRVVQSPDALVFHMDVVLLPTHPRYSKPRNDEKYCYKRANLSFSGVSSLKWHRSSSEPFIDATGEADYGNIDDFRIENNRFYLEGDWGAVSFLAEGVVLELLPE